MYYLVVSHQMSIITPFQMQLLFLIFCYIVLYGPLRIDHMPHIYINNRKVFVRVYVRVCVSAKASEIYFR